jgi:formiminotetrahydrofolate cyclodeaminase
MVARVTVARGARGAVRGARGSAGDGQGAAAVTVARVARSADRLRRRLTLLIARDADAFGAVLAARRTAPSRSHARGALGSARVQRALRAATEVPLEVARKSADVVALGAALAPRARLSTLADLGTAAALAGAALEAGALTARANLEDLEDRAFVTRSARELERLSAAGARVRGRLARACVAGRRRGPSAKRRGGPAAA